MVRKGIAPDYDLSYRFSADYDWTIRCIKNADESRCTNLGTVTIDYLSDGLTDRNKPKSLRERYRVMARHYGHLPGIATACRACGGKGFWKAMKNSLTAKVLKVIGGVFGERKHSGSYALWSR